MKKVYIVLTCTGTVLSHIIRFYTKSEFTHVSISLDENLNEMYSFGRLNAYNPFIGGFIHEYIDKGTFKRFNKTKAKIFSLEITDEQYKNIKDNIQKFQEQRRKYKFNVVGLFAVAIHKKIQPEYSFYCAEFSKHLFKEAGIETELPTIVKPEDFKKINGLEEVYNGILKQYNSKNNIIRPQTGVFTENLKQKPICLKKYNSNTQIKDDDKIGIKIV